MAKKNPTYADLGVSHQKEEVHAALTGIDQGLYPDAFCKIIPDLAGDPNYCSVMHADGAGTKSAVAYMMYRETGNLKYFKGIVQDSITMNTDDVICVGGIGPFFLSNTVGRNKKLITGEIIATIIQAYENFAKKLQAMNIPLYTAGGETADVGDVVRTLILDSTLTTRFPKSHAITPGNIKTGDVIVGFSSTGKTKYESDWEYNSGIGSNGLTLARHGLLDHQYFKKYPESYSPELEEELVFFGKHALSDKVPGTPLTVGEAILSPTRTYLPVMIPLIKENRSEIHCIFHNTGGAQTKCLKFGKGIHYIKDNLFPTPPFFKFIQQSSNTDWLEMYKVFNMGHRMEIICSEDFAKNKVLPFAKSFELDAQIVGHIEKSKSNQNELTINTSNGNFHVE